MRQCPFCGKMVPGSAIQCPFCRDALPEVPVVRRVAHDGGGKIRRGLLFMFLAAVIGYFGGGYSGLNLPVLLQPAVLSFLSLFLFFSGFGLCAYGYYLQHRTSRHAHTH